MKYIGNNDIEEFMIEKIRETLNIEEIDESLSFYDHGGDSLTFVIFVSEVLDQFDQSLSGIELKLSGIQPLGQILSLFSNHNHNEDNLNEDNLNGALSIDNSHIENSSDLNCNIPATANRYSYLLKMGADLEKWIIHSPVYELKKIITSEELSNSYAVIQGKFDGLRLRVRYSNGLFEQSISDNNVRVVEVKVNQQLEEFQVKDLIIKNIYNLRQQLSLSNNTALLLVTDNSNNKSYVVLVFHHILLDSVSLREVEKALIDCLTSGNKMLTGSNTTIKSYKDYCIEYFQHCEKLAQSSSEYWTNLPWAHVSSTPLDYENHKNELSHEWTKECNLKFDGSCFDLAIKALAKNSNMSVSNLILVSLSRAYSKWSGLDYMLLDLAHHGRVAEQGMVDFAKTVGWINETIPMIFNNNLLDKELIQETKNQLARMSVEASLFNYCKYLTNETKISNQFRSYPSPDISLNIELTHSEPKFTSSSVKIHSWSVENSIGNRVHQIAGGVVRKNDYLFLQLDYNSKAFKERHVEALLELWGSEFVSLLNQYSKVNLIGV